MKFWKWSFFGSKLHFFAKKIENMIFRMYLVLHRLPKTIQKMLKLVNNLFFDSKKTFFQFFFIILEQKWYKNLDFWQKNAILSQNMTIFQNFIKWPENNIPGHYIAQNVRKELSDKLFNARSPYHNGFQKYSNFRPQGYKFDPQNFLSFLVLCLLCSK